MSLYDHGFTFLPPPARSLLSFGNETTRAQLPNFQTVTELSNFIERLMVYQIPLNGFWIQIKFCASFVCLLLLIVVGILSGRVYEKTFWIIRAMKRPSGTVLVPNSMLAFSLVEGIYGALFVALFWECVKFFENHSSSPTNFILWMQLTWIPLIIGASMAAWGTYFAIPNTTQQSFGVQSQKISIRMQIYRFISHSYFINAATLFTPFAIVASILVPTIWGNSLWNQALKRRELWLQMYSNQSSFTQEMVTDAQNVWYQLLPAMRLSSIAMILWTIWAFAIFITYTSIAIRLVLTVKRELFKVENAKGAYRGFAVSTYHGEPNEAEQEADPKVQAEKLSRLQHAKALHRGREDHQDDSTAGGLGVNLHAVKQNPSPNLSPISKEKDGFQVSNVTLDRKNSDATVLNEHGLRHSNSKSALVANDSLNQVGNTNGTDVSNSEEDLANVLDRGIPMQFDEEGAIEAIRKTKKKSNKVVGNSTDGGEDIQKPPVKKSFIPNLMLQNRHVPGTTKQLGANGRAQQKDALKKAFIHVCIQAIAISPACFLFMGVACLLAIGNYGGTEQPNNGGIIFEVMIGYALTFAMWTTVVFGSITLFAIAFRTYESVLTIVSFPSMMGQNSSSGANAAKSPRAARNPLNSGSGSSGQRSGSNADYNSPGSPRTFESNERSWRRLSIPLSINKRKQNIINNNRSGGGDGLGIGMETSFFETETRHQPSQGRNGRVANEGDLTYEMSSLNSHSYNKDTFSRMNEMEVGPLESFAEMPKDERGYKRTVGTIRETSGGSPNQSDRHQARAYRRNDDDDEGSSQHWSPKQNSTYSSPNPNSTTSKKQNRQRTPQESLFDETQSYSDPEDERRYFQGGAGRRRASLKGGKQGSQRN